MVGHDTNSQWIGGYHLLREIGRGGTGTVWEAEDEGGGRVALKLLHPSLAATEEARLRLLREARLVNQVRSQNVVRVLDVEADAYAPFVVTELVHGPTLEGEISRLPFQAADAALLATELAQTLDAVHGAGIAHRDLKPSNIILTRAGPTLIDFGIAQGEGDRQLTLTGTITGTPGYLSPELLIASHRPDLATLQAGDWFAFASLLLKSMTGRPPFGTGRPEVVLQRVLDGLPDTEGMDERHAAAFSWALHPSADHRLGPDDLIHCLEGGALPARSPELRRPTRDGSPTRLGEVGRPLTEPPLALGDVSAHVSTPIEPALHADASTVSGPVHATHWGLPPSALKQTDVVSASLPPGYEPDSTTALEHFGATPNAGAAGLGPDPWAYPPGPVTGWPTAIEPDAVPVEPAPAGPRGPAGVAFTAALLACLAWLPVFLGPYGLAIVALFLLVLQCIGRFTIAAWRRRVAGNGGRRRRFAAAFAAPWHLVMAVISMVPGLAVGVMVGYVALFLSAGVFSDTWDLAGPLAWSWQVGNAWAIPPFVSWLAVCAGLLALWVLPTTNASRVGLQAATRRIFLRPRPRWLCVGGLVVLALLGVATSVQN